MRANAGIIVWFTGLPSSGKTTLATRVRERVGNCVMLDSDAIREVLSPGDELSSDPPYQPLGRLADFIARQGHVVLVAATAPYRAHRDAVRALAPAFIEVYVNTPLEVCQQRDVKGHYARAHRGDAPGLSEVSEPYEAPLTPDVVASGGYDDHAIATIARLITSHRLVDPISDRQ
jgi:adenylylsulfate kinase